MESLSTFKVSSRILIADDDEAVLRLLRWAFQAEGYDLIFAQDGVEAIEAINVQHPELSILDINVPKLNGLEVCRQAREVSHVPIIVISGRGSEEEKVQAFELGVDDYVTKPFSLRELEARVRAMLRRSAQADVARNHDVFRYADLEIDFPARRVRSRGREVNTTPIEFDLLRLLALNAGKVLTHQMLVRQVWGPEYGEEREYLRVHLSHLGHKIERDPTHPRYIQTVPRIGYRFEAQKEG